MSKLYLRFFTLVVALFLDTKLKEEEKDLFSVNFGSKLNYILKIFGMMLIKEKRIIYK